MKLKSSGERVTNVQDLEDVEATIPEEFVSLKSKWGQTNIGRRGVFRLRAKGFSNKDICSLLGISHTTLLDNFSRECDLGSANLKTSLKAHLVREALRDKPQPALLIYALKAFANVTEAGTNEDGDPNEANNMALTINVLQKPEK